MSTMSKAALCAWLIVSVATMSLSAPQMGWNTWNAYKTDFNETILKQTADVMISSGLRSAGYEYLIADSGWQASTRDSSGRQRANATKFPNGIATFINYVHSKGLKMGIYSDAG